MHSKQIFLLHSSGKRPLHYDKSLLVLGNIRPISTRISWQSAKQKLTIFLILYFAGIKTQMLSMAPWLHGTFFDQIMNFVMHHQDVQGLNIQIMQTFLLPAVLTYRNMPLPLNKMPAGQKVSLYRLLRQLETPEDQFKLGLAMRLRIHAVHADDAHVKILMRISHIQRQKKTIIPWLIPPAIYAVMHVLDLDLAVERASHQCE